MNVKLTNEVVMDIIKKPAVQRVSADLKRLYFNVKDFNPKTCCGSANQDSKVRTSLESAAKIILGMSNDDKQKIKSILGMSKDEHFIR